MPNEREQPFDEPFRPVDNQRADDVAVDEVDYDDYEDEYAGPVSYRVVNPLAVASLALGVLSFLTMFSWFLFVIPIAAIIFGWMALTKMARLPGQYTGGRLAVAGILSAVVLWTFGMGYMAFVAGAEVPLGYTRVTFTQMQPDADTPGEVIPQKILDLQFDETALDKKRVFIKGYIFPGRQTIGLKEFILVPTQSHCKFCSRQLKSTEMVFVKLEGDLQTNYRTRMTSIGGKLTVNKAEAAKPLGGLPYRIDADYVH